MWQQIIATKDELLWEMLTSANNGRNEQKQQ